VALAGLLVLTQRAFVRMTTPAWAATGCLAGAVPFAHARFTLVPVVWLACVFPYIGRTVAWVPARRWRTAAVTTLCVGVVYLAGAAVYRRVVGELWTHPASASPGLLHTTLTPSRWPRLLAELAGQAWYAIAASFGLAAVGAIWSAQSLARRSELPRAKRATIVTTSVVFASVVGASVAIVANGIIQRGGRPIGRLDYYVHGRYVDGVVLILAAVGLAHLLSADGRRRLIPAGALIVAAFLALTAVVLWQLPSGIHGFLGPSIAGVYFFPFVHGFVIVIWTLVAAGAFAAIVALTRLRSARSVVLITALLAAASFGASANAIRDHQQWARRPLYALVPPPSAGRDTVLVAADVAEEHSYRLYAFIQAYVLTGRGWRFELSNLDSASLSAAPGPRTGVIVVLRSQPVRAPAWGMAGEEAEAAVWFRGR
jgi:hypothetical protein